MLPILSNFAHWRVLAAVGLAALLAGGGWWVRARIADAAADRLALAQARQQIEATQRRLAQAESLGKADAAAAIHYANQAAAAERTADRLREAVFAATQRGQLTTRPDEDPADASPDDPAPPDVLSRKFRLCFNAATTGDAAAVAACETGSGDAPGGAAMLASAVVR